MPGTRDEETYTADELHEDIEGVRRLLEPLEKVVKEMRASGCRELTSRTVKAKNRAWNGLILWATNANRALQLWNAPAPKRRGRPVKPVKRRSPPQKGASNA